MNMSLDPQAAAAAIGTSAVLRHYERRRQMLDQAKAYQGLLDMLSGDASGLEAIPVVVVPTSHPENRNGIDRVLERLDDIAARLERIESSIPDQVSMHAVAIDEPDVETGDPGADESVIDLTGLLRTGMDADPTTLRSLADLEDVVEAEEAVEPVVSSSGPATEAATISIHGIDVPALPVAGDVDFLGVACPGEEIEFLQKAVNDARAAYEAGVSKAPYGGHYKYRWRRQAWLAAQEHWRRGSVDSVAQAEPSAAETEGDEHATPTMAEVPSPSAVVEPRKLPPNKEVREIVAGLMTKRFPTGATISEIMEALQPDYDVRGKNPNYWWLLLSEGPFDLDQSNGRWTLAA